MRKDLMPQLAFFASICRKSREERPADIQQPAAFMKKESASHFFSQYQNVLLENCWKKCETRNNRFEQKFETVRFSI